jgi:Mn2+/Fe2+ NRAMP family transporter
VKKLFALMLGVLTAIGGFVDIGDLVTNGLVGARFGMSLAWVVVVGVGICVFAEMSGRVAAVSGRATFDLIRERLGPRVGVANLVASMLVTFLTFAAEIGGVALALQLATSVNRYLWILVVGAAVWLVLWRVNSRRSRTRSGWPGWPSSSSRWRCGSSAPTGRPSGPMRFD